MLDSLYQNLWIRGAFLFLLGVFLHGGHSFGGVTPPPIADGMRIESEKILRNLYTRLEQEKLQLGEPVNFDQNEEIQFFLSSMGEESLPNTLSFLKVFNQISNVSSISVRAKNSGETLQPVLDLSEDQSFDQLISLFEKKESWTKWGTVESLTLRSSLGLGALFGPYSLPILSLALDNFCQDHNCGTLNLFSKESTIDLSPFSRAALSISLITIDTGIMTAMLYCGNHLQDTVVRSWSKWQLKRLQKRIDHWTAELSEKTGIRHLDDMTRLLLDPRAISAPAWNESDTSCPVCLQEYQSELEVSITECHHKFCQSCINAIKKSVVPSARICPICRTTLESLDEDDYPLFPAFDQP